MEGHSGAYLIPRGSGRRGGRNRQGGGRGAAVLILILLLLTVAILLLVVFLPRVQTATVDGGFSGRTYYCLVGGESATRAESAALAETNAGQGGAGYVLNDGTYRVISAVYEREADAKALASVNPDASYLAVEIPAVHSGEGEVSLLGYFCDEWFPAVYNAAAELDRGNITESAAEYAVRSMCERLADMSDGLNSAALRRAVTRACEYEVGGRSVLSYIRFVGVRAVVNIAAALGA